MEQKTKRKTITRSSEEKKALCEEWKASGKSKFVFCKEHNIALDTFYGWCNKLHPPSKESNVVPVKIINKAARLSEVETDKSEIELALGSTMLIRFKLPVKNLVLFIQELSHAVTTIR